MKTKRAYYDDPVMALLALKHGIRLCYLSCSGQTIHVDKRMIAAMISAYIANNEPMAVYYYIHPDDMHLLEPQSDDWGSDGIHAGRVVNIGNGTVTISVPRRHNNKEYYVVNLNGFTLDKRNNMPFPWPEFEEISLPEAAK